MGLQARLRRVEGQVRGLQRLVDEEIVTEATAAIDRLLKS